MSVAPLAVRTRLVALPVLVAACLGAALVVAQAAAADPATPSPAGSSSSASAGSGAPSSSATSASTPVRKPAATAPTTPGDYGPPCTTNAQALNPVICLPAGSGEDQAATATPGAELEFDAQVVNNGPDVADADVVITLPDGLELESDEDDPVYRIDGWYDEGDDGGYTDLTCRTGPSSITCSVGALKTHDNVLIAVDLGVSPQAAPGTTLSFQVALEPVGEPTYESTSVSASIDVLEPSHLVVSLTPATLRTVVGHQGVMTGIVHNAGSGAAPDTLAVAITDDEKHPKKTHFAITSGIGAGALIDGDDGDSGSAAAVPDPSGVGSTVVVVGGESSSSLHAQLQRQALARDAATVRRDALPSLRFWPLGTIAPGATQRVTIKLKALSVGTDSLAFGAISLNDDLECSALGSGSSGSESGGATESATPLDRVPAAVSTTTAAADCSFVVETHITAIPEPAATDALANSGTHQLDAQLGIALWAVVLGSLLVWVGRRRVVGRRHG